VFETLRNIGFEEFSELNVRWWNIAPSLTVPIVRMDGDGKRVIAPAQWGFVPAWSKEWPKTRPINARAETVSTSGMFRQAFNSGRCLVPADGFYEWQGTKPPRRPYFIHLKDDGVFAFAGLWSRWTSPDKPDPIDTFTIITTEPNELVRSIHNRMPVVLRPQDYGRWLDPNLPGKEVTGLLTPYAADGMDAYAITSAVNSPKNDGPELIEPAVDPK
jgi:putative SOS response-associated peptidase YedK